MNDNYIKENKMKHTVHPLLEEMDLRKRQPSIEDRPEVFRETSHFQSLEHVDSSLYQTVMSALETVIDPELGIDIVNMGLIYDVLTDEDFNVFVRMTLTTPYCPLGDHIVEMVEEALESVEGLLEVGIELVFDPAWHPERLSRVARIALGFARPND